MEPPINSFMVEIIGWIGAILFAISCAPQAIKTYKSKQAKDLSMWMLQLWFWGEIFSLIYIMNNVTLQWPLITNYTFNAIMVGYLIYAKIKY